MTLGDLGIQEVFGGIDHGSFSGEDTRLSWLGVSRGSGDPSFKARLASPPIKSIPGGGGRPTLWAGPLTGQGSASLGPAPRWYPPWKRAVRSLWSSEDTAALSPPWTAACVEASVPLSSFLCSRLTGPLSSFNVGDRLCVSVGLLGGSACGRGPPCPHRPRPLRGAQTHREEGNRPWQEPLREVRLVGLK